MISVHPYLGWSFPQGFGLWATVRGGIEIDDEQVDRQMKGDSFDRCKRLSLLRKSEGRKIFSPKNQPEKPKYLDIHANS